jgi:hypothetical protein
LQKCLQIADIFSLFLFHKCLLPKCKNLKNHAANYLYNRQTFYWNIPKWTKMLVQTNSRLKTDNWFIGINPFKHEYTNWFIWIFKFFLLTPFYRLINLILHNINKQTKKIKPLCVLCLLTRISSPTTHPHTKIGTSWLCISFYHHHYHQHHHRIHFIQFM